MAAEETAQEKQLHDKVRQLIVEHYKTIEETRMKDRELWKMYSRRLEGLEQLRSERGKRRTYKRKENKPDDAAVMENAVLETAEPIHEKEMPAEVKPVKEEEKHSDKSAHDNSDKAE